MRIADINMMDAFEAYYNATGDAYEVEEILDSNYNAENYPGKVKFKQKYDIVDGEKVYRYKKPKFIKIDGAALLDFATSKDLAMIAYEGDLTQEEIDLWTKAKDVIKYCEDNHQTYFIVNIDTL